MRYLADGLNRFQRLAGFVSGHGEGWALYAERLMGELGYLADPAYELGMLPYRLHPSVRSTDPVTELACNRAMRELGASDLFMPGKPVLRFASEEEAEKARSHLEKQLPGSHWLLDKDVALREL